MKDDGRLVDLISRRDVSLIPRERWDTTTVGNAMRPLRELQIVAPGTLVLDAVKLAANNVVDPMPVVENGRLLGVVFRSQLVHALQSQSEVSPLQVYQRLPYGTEKAAESNARPQQMRP